MHASLMGAMAILLALASSALAWSEPADFDKLWDFAHPDKTEAKFRELLQDAPASEDEGYRLQLLTQIARAEGLQEKFDQAHATLDRVKGRLDGAPAVVRVRYLLERGRVLNSSKHADQATPLFLQAWELARKSGEDFYAVDAAHMLQIVEPSEEALKWGEKALALAEASKDPRAAQWLGPLYNNIGWTYHDQGNYEKALALFQKGLAWRREQHQAEPTRIAKWAVGRALRSLGRLDEALKLQQELLEEYRAAGSTNGYVFEELAELHLARGDSHKARQYFAQAYDELSKDPWLVDNEPDHLARLKKLGKVEPPRSAAGKRDR